METYQFIILIVLSVVSLALSLILLIYNLIKHPRGEGGSNERLVSAISEVEKRLCIKLDASSDESARDI